MYTVSTGSCWSCRVTRWRGSDRPGRVHPAHTLVQGIQLLIGKYGGPSLTQFVHVGSSLLINLQQGHQDHSGILLHFIGKILQTVQAMQGNLRVYCSPLIHQLQNCTVQASVLEKKRGVPNQNLSLQLVSINIKCDTKNVEDNQQQGFQGQVTNVGFCPTRPTWGQANTHPSVVSIIAHLLPSNH